MLPGTSGSLPQHSDVLSVDTPSDPAEVVKLVEEIKRRGNHAFKAGSLLEAETLYSRALEHDPAQAALWGNRCAARLGMKKFAEALVDADRAIQVQADWGKGHFRRGQCLSGLGRWADAKRAFEQAVAIEPNNVEAKKEAAKAAEMISTPSSAAPPKASKAPPRASAAEKPSHAKDDGDDEEGEKFRGYKKLDDGRTTTFFHRELPAEEKARLAHNVPQKVSGEAVKAPTPADKNGGSVWNAAGTFEERDMTTWAKERLTAMIKGTTTVFEEGEGVVEVTGVSEIEGGASVSFIRGAKRYPFDFTFAVEWSADVDNKTVTGRLFYSEFSSESSDTEAELRWPEREKAGAKASALAKHVKTALKGAVDERLRDFVVEFKAL